MSMAPCTCGQCQLCRVQDGFARCVKDNADLRARVEDLNNELEESARLHGKGSEREAALITRATRAEAERDEAKGRVEKLEKVRNAAANALRDVTGAWVDVLRAALAECGEGE